MSRYCFAALAALLAFALITPATAQDADGDRIPDDVEEMLATDAQFAEELELVAESPAKPELTGDDARFNIRRVYFGNVAQGRWLWRIEFEIPYNFDNDSIIVYVDSDNDPTTGRPGMGCETTYGHSSGSPSQMYYLGPERADEFAPPRVALADGALYICADFPLNQEDGRSKFRMTILSEQREPHESRDSLGWRDIDAPGDSDREKVKTLGDMTESENFLDTQSAELLWKIQADERNVIINSFQDCEYEGFRYNHSEYRWPSLIKSSGRAFVRATVPRSGEFFPAVVVYDGSGGEGWEMLINGESVGRFPLKEDNRRQRLFFLPEAVQLKRGDIVEMRPSATGGAHLIEDIVLLADRPPVLRPPRNITNLQVTWDWERAANRVTWVTTWPVACTVTCGDAEVVEETPIQNHRVWLPDIQAGQARCAINALNERDGDTVSASVRFTAGEPAPPKGSVARESIELAVLGRHDDTSAAEITTGVPFARGELGDTGHLLITDARGNEMPLQARALVRWPDGSVKIALLDAVVPPAGDLTLEYGREVTRTEAQGVLVSQAIDSILVDTRAMQVEFDATSSGLFASVETNGVQLLRADRQPRIVLTDEAGNVYDTLGPPDSLVVEEAGPIRTVVRADGHHTGESGELFSYQIRFTFRLWSPTIEISYRWGNDRSEELSTIFRRAVEPDHRDQLPLGQRPFGGTLHHLPAHPAGGAAGPRR